MTVLKQQLLYIKDVELLTGRSAMTLRRWWKQGTFPKPTKHSVLIWRTDVIEQWINQNIQRNEHE